jgi:hypothetical protein
LASENSNGVSSANHGSEPHQALPPALEDTRHFRVDLMRRRHLKPTVLASAEREALGEQLAALLSQIEHLLSK